MDGPDTWPPPGHRDGAVPPPAPPRWTPPATTSSRPHLAWWQRGPVVAALVLVAFTVGVGAGSVGRLTAEFVGAATGLGAPAAGGAEQLSGASPPDAADARPLPEREVVTLPEAELVVASDGCGVVRSELAPEPHGLQWSVRDTDGFEVLGRNALGETHYRYFRPGTFTVVLVAWDGQEYAPISNTVTIEC